MKKGTLLSAAGLTLVAILTAISCTKESTSTVDCNKYNSTYNSNMKAIIDAKCGTCHTAGGSAQFSGVYDSYADMKNGLDVMWLEIKEGRMPQPGSTPLTAEEKEAFECWEKAGFPEN